MSHAKPRRVQSLALETMTKPPSSANWSYPPTNKNRASMRRVRVEPKSGDAGDWETCTTQGRIVSTKVNAKQMCHYNDKPRVPPVVAGKEGETETDYSRKGRQYRHLWYGVFCLPTGS